MTPTTKLIINITIACVISLAIEMTFWVYVPEASVWFNMGTVIGSLIVGTSIFILLSLMDFISLWVRLKWAAKNFLISLFTEQRELPDYYNPDQDLGI